MMAKLHGFELKSMKTGRGMEGISTHATVYLNGHKLGYYSDFGDGGCARYEFDGVSACDLGDRVATQFPEYKTYDWMSDTDVLDMLMAELADLTDAEKVARRNWTGKRIPDAFEAVTVYERDADGRQNWFVLRVPATMNNPELRDTVMRNADEGSKVIDWKVDVRPTFEFGKRLDTKGLWKTNGRKAKAAIATSK